LNLEPKSPRLETLILTPIYSNSFKTTGEFIFLCAYYGLMQPALVAFSRALYSQLIPKGHENEMFSLFSITTAGGGWVRNKFILHQSMNMDKY
jgi:MFS-type transporter involved in bile tolerance (Atg22 family)